MNRRIIWGACKDTLACTTLRHAASGVEDQPVFPRKFSYLSLPCTPLVEEHCTDSQNTLRGIWIQDWQLFSGKPQKVREASGYFYLTDVKVHFKR